MNKCTIPPIGWRCTRAAGHSGPCAAIPDNATRDADHGAAIEGLLPCPFCGNKPRENDINSEDYTGERYGYCSVECLHCNGGIGSQGRFAGVHADSKEEARTVWNQRALVTTVTNSQQKGGESECHGTQLEPCASNAAPTSDPEGAATPADLTFAIPNSLEASVLKIAKERDSALQEAKRWKEMARSQDDSPSRRLHEECKALMQKCATLDVENHTLFQKLAELETRTASICIKATARASRIFAEYERLDAMISEDEGRDRGSFWVPYYKEFKEFLASLI